MFVAYLGPKGSFTHHVALESFEDGELRPYDSITEVMKAYESAQVEYAVIPVENSIEGVSMRRLTTSFTRLVFRLLQKWFIPLSNNSWQLSRIKPLR